MSTSKDGQTQQIANSFTTGDTNAPQRQSVCVDPGVGSEQWQIADIQAGLQEADQGEFASAQEVRAVFAKYGH
jgi:predicted transcriptional regulator